MGSLLITDSEFANKVSKECSKVYQCDITDTFKFNNFCSRSYDVLSERYKKCTKYQNSQKEYNKLERYFVGTTSYSYFICN